MSSFHEHRKSIPKYNLMKNSIHTRNIKESIQMEEGNQPPNHVEPIKEPPLVLGDDKGYNSHSRPKLTPVNQRIQHDSMRLKHKDTIPKYNK